MLDFGRELSGNLEVASKREWLVTNGLGGYASGTIAGILTRRYHGLLVAALHPPVERTLLLVKVEEVIEYHGRFHNLFTDHWAEGVIEPQGYTYIERFRLEGTTPVWTFVCGDAVLEKRVWMQQGANTTYTRYDLVESDESLTFTLKMLVNYRDHHQLIRDLGRWMRVEPVGRGLRIVAQDSAVPFYLFCEKAKVYTKHEWYRDFYLRLEEYRGMDRVEDHLCVGNFQAHLEPGESLLFVASTEPMPNMDSDVAYAEHQARERQLQEQAGVLESPPAIQQLVLAADQFVVCREFPDEPEGRTLIAGYPWFGDWSRDTMIALPGLTLATGQYTVARQILHTFARFVDQGMLPNNFPEIGETPGYNTVDATLWYFEALRAYYAATGDAELLRELFPVLQEIIEWHQRGARYQIHVDPEDGLLYAGEAGIQLTWMDVKIDAWVVTPRTGKPVEVNALWYNALRTMAEFAQQLGEPAEAYVTAAECVQKNFTRFWNAETGYCYDVIDGPDGDDPSLRPNQLLAVSLPHSLLDAEKQRAIVDVCAAKLLTPFGLRSLAAEDAAYIGHYGGNQRQRDAVYHQGTVWPWLMGPFIVAHLRVYNDPEQARVYLQPLLMHLEEHGVGSISEIFDGDAPFTPRGCIAQAWSVAEVLRVWKLLEERKGRK